MKNLKFRQCLAAIVLSSTIACAPIVFAGCDKEKTDETKSSETTEEEADEEEDEVEEEETTTEVDPSKQQLIDDIMDEYDITDEDKVTVIEYEEGDYYISIEVDSGDSEPNNNLGPYVFDGDFNHSELDDFAQECASKGWPIEVLTAADLNLKDNEFAEGFVAYDISEYPHYYLYYKDHDTAYENLEDYIVGSDGSISHVYGSVDPDTYWVDFDDGKHMMDVYIYESGLAIFDDNRVTTFEYDPNAETNPANITYDTDEINDLVKEYVDKKYKLFDLSDSTTTFPNAVEGFTGYGWYWPDDSDYVLEDYEIYVVKFNSVDDALSGVGIAFNRDFRDLADDTNIYLEFERFSVEYTGSISQDGLLILKGLEKH